jgi:hypothetical protein
MSIELTFKSVCTTIKKHGNDDPKLIEAVDSLLGLALICSPAVLGPTAAALLPTLAAKNELVKIGKSVFDKLTKKKEEDYLLRYETMRTAYGLLVFTSFFDALDFRLPEALRKEIGLLESEKAFIVNEGVKKSSPNKQNEHTCEAHGAPVFTTTIAFPHPTETLTEQCQRQTKLWKQMSQGFVEFVQKLAFWEDADEAKRAVFLGGLGKLEDEAVKRFEAQYFELARKFEDFAVWANLQAHKGTHALIAEMSDYVKHHAKLSAASEGSIDVGFSNLRQAVLSIPETLRIEQATEIADSFNKHYQARINEPIIEDKDVGDEDGPRLTFPKICDAFVPQAFRVLRQPGKSRRLEDEATWSNFPRRCDLGAFLLSYLSSPYSTDTPLLILGHPGSGKSLLTTILAAQLMSKQFTAIRVPLREVNADADIPTQIEEFIKRISGVSFDSWIKLRTLFKNCPPIVILDGYDELLQASGQVFASYIMEAQRFQQHQTEQGWPVRIIITSRVTLIDKAAVPMGSTIVRLMEFDEYQRECWSVIWNKANAAYFRDTNLEKFALPSAREKGADKILNLAEQPLLLLMLALYDSQGNQLRTSQGLDRTKLYDSLLRRFVVRERGKERGFNDEKVKERDKALTIEMQRLGVAALGMYNRRKVHILSTELDDDLAFFKLEREVAPKSGKALSQADLLLGSFFFVHKSKAQHSSGAEDTHEESSAFEFLHNTFGEFLTADFIIRRSLAQVQALRAAEASELLRSMMDKMMGTADGFERDWFASLVYTPLFTRPVILEMIREWAPHVLRAHALSEGDFVETLDKIVLNQTKRLLSKREMPQIMRKETAQEGYRVPFGDHPLVGHIAIYSINLILLRLVSGKAPFIFDESEIASHEDGTRPWDRLMHIWRSWFSLGNLNGLTAVMVADRSETMIKVAAKEKFQAEETTGKLQEFYNVALSLGDDVSACIAGLWLFDPTRWLPENLDKLEKMGRSEGLDLGTPALLAKLQVLARSVDDSPGEFAEHSRSTLERAMRLGRPDQIESICQVIARTLEQSYLRRYRGTRHSQTFRHIFESDFAVDLAMRDPRSGRILFGLGKRIRDFGWVFEFSRRFLDVFAHKVPLFEAEAWSSDAGQSLELLELFKEIGGAGALFRHARNRDIDPKFLDRILDPRHLLELSERNPEGALAYLQVLRDLGGGRYLEEHAGRRRDPKLIDRMFDPRDLLKLSERNPEGALAYLQILRKLGGRRYFEEFLGRRMGSKLVDRMFDPRHLLELSERNPEGALAYVQVLRELGGKRYFEELLGRRMDPELIDRVFDPSHLIELSERNPEGALAFLRILRELGGGRFKEYVGRRMDPEHIDRLFDIRILLELSECSLEVALAYVQVLRELVGRRYFEEFLGRRRDSKLVDRMFDSRHLLELVERNPQGALAYLQILRELGGGRNFEEWFGRHVGPELIDRMFDPRHLLELSERNPQGALAYLQILRELGDRPYFDEYVGRRMDPELIDRMFDSRRMQNLETLKIESLGVWLALAHLLKSKSALNKIDKVIKGLLADRPSFGAHLSALPIASLPDLRWLAEQSESNEIRSLVDELTT